MRLVILTVTLLVLVSFPLALGGCSSGSQSPSDGGTRDVTLLCVPGQSVACVGPGGCSGGQVCGADGVSFGPCDCSHPSSEAGSDGSSPTDATTDADGPTGDAAVADVAIADGTSTDAPTEAEASTGDSGFVACDSRTTTITGKVYDPAGKNPVYDVDVYIPGSPLPVLPKGVPTGAGACSCSALYPSGMLAKTRTGIDGTFTLTNVPAGSSVPLVIQIGKWRHEVAIDVTPCQDNPQPDKSLTMPGTVAPGSGDNMPEIAVSTGSADTLECLLRRVGLPTTEYVAGAATSGHVHVFSGGEPINVSHGAVGAPEANPMPGAPESDTTLWDSAAHLMPYDITLLSCEGGETYNANPAVLEQYLNAGGRVFASHFHYAWFAGPIGSMQTYSAPSAWGANLATWAAGSNGSGANPIGGIVDTTLNGSSTPFPKGQALQQWLANVGALGQNGVPSTEVSIYSPRYNAVVDSNNKPSQPWLTSDSSGMAGQTMSFSFDTPVSSNPPPTGVTYCGRAIYSDLHVTGNPASMDNPSMLPPPASCANVDLSAQEKVLEFMLFDLSGCVVPDSSTP